MNDSKHTTILLQYNRRIRVTIPEQTLALFYRNSTEFLHRFATIDETWIHHYTLESHKESKHSFKLGKSAPKRQKTQQYLYACISSIVSKRCPRSGLLSLGNSQKSRGAKSRRKWWLWNNMR